METLSEHVRARVHCPTTEKGERGADCAAMQQLLVAAEPFMPTEAEMRAFYQKVAAAGGGEQEMAPPFVEGLEAAKRLMTAAVYAVRYLMTEPGGTVQGDYFHEKAAIEFISKIFRSSLRAARVGAFLLDLGEVPTVDVDVYPPPQGHA